MGLIRPLTCTKTPNWLVPFVQYSWVFLLNGDHAQKQQEDRESNPIIGMRILKNHTTDFTIPRGPSENRHNMGTITFCDQSVTTPQPPYRYHYILRPMSKGQQWITHKLLSWNSVHAKHQHGFWVGRTTTTALRLQQRIDQSPIKQWGAWSCHLQFWHRSLWLSEDSTNSVLNWLSKMGLTFFWWLETSGSYQRN